METFECVSSVFWERMGAFSRLGRLASIVPYGMVWYGTYVSKHKHNENLGTFGCVLDRLEARGKRLNAFRAFPERMGAIGRLGRLQKTHVECFGTFLMSFERFGVVWERFAR